MPRTITIPDGEDYGLVDDEGREWLYVERVTDDGRCECYWHHFRPEGRWMTDMLPCRHQKRGTRSPRIVFIDEAGTHWMENLTAETTTVAYYKQTFDCSVKELQSARVRDRMENGMFRLTEVVRLQAAFGHEPDRYAQMTDEQRAAQLVGRRLHRVWRLRREIRSKELVLDQPTRSATYRSLLEQLADVETRLREENGITPAIIDLALDADNDGKFRVEDSEHADPASRRRGRMYANRLEELRLGAWTLETAATIGENPTAETVGAAELLGWETT